MFVKGLRGNKADPYCVKIDVDGANNCLNATVFYLDGYVHTPKEIHSFEFRSVDSFLEKLRSYPLNPGHIECLGEDVWIAKECLRTGARFEQGDKPEPHLWRYAC